MSTTATPAWPTLTSLHELLSVSDPLELKEPGEEELALARKYFDNGKRLMDRI